MTALRTRKPSGQVAWPLILLEGDEKAGKSYAAYSLSADERVGRTFVFEFGEGIADEYAQLGPYEIVDHNGTYTDLLAQVEAACAEPTEPGKPNVVVIDQMTELWGLLNKWAEGRARNSRAARKKLQDDPDATIDIPTNLHNDKADRWYRVLNTIRRSDVIGVLVCRGKEVTKFANGQPVAGETDYSIEGHKGTPFAVKAHVRMTKPHTATLMSAASLNVDLPRGGRVLADSNPLGELVFDILGCGEGSTGRPLAHGVVGIAIPDAQRRFLELVERVGNEDGEAAKQTARRLWSRWVKGKPEEISPDDLAALLDKAAAWLERSTKPVGVKDVAIRAGEVFAGHADSAKGHKVVDGLRHALVRELTSGKSMSSNDLNPTQLRALSGWLDDIEDGEIKVTVDDKGVSFTWADESTTAFTWVDLEPIDGRAAKEAFDQAHEEMAS